MTKFLDPQLGVYTSTIVKEGSPVLLVFHDHDGDWQFLTSTESREEEIIIADVGHLQDSDDTLHQVGDLPTRWKAWRERPTEPWQREPIPDDQSEV